MTPEGKEAEASPPVALNYALPPKDSSPIVWRWMLPCSVVGLFLAIAMLTQVATNRNYSRSGSNRDRCSSNMRQIGFGIAMYANNHGGQFPPDLETELEQEDLTPSAFVCPSSNDVPAPTLATTQGTAMGLLTAGHDSYVYLGKGLTDKTATTDVVLVYEPLVNHLGDGMNVMFGDFHVEWYSAKQAQPILLQVKAGVFPVRIPAATQPAS